jgi:NAD(P)-dependent dehydrogenase (short-subunit alcohol dehydrogenase family)
MRTFYCTSKFGLDGFSKSLASEEPGLSMCICYPAYVQTNIAKSALVGKGVPMGKTDWSIGNGIKVRPACLDLVKAIYTKRFWITLEPNIYYSVMARV